MEDKATIGNNFRDTNGLPSLKRKFGKGHGQSPSKRMKPMAVTAG